MDTSSEDSFAWTNTSNDDSCAEPMLAYEEESDFGKSFKKKLKKELFQNGDHDHEVPEPETPRARKKKVKREPSSPPAADSGAERSPRRPVKDEASPARRSPAADSSAERSPRRPLKDETGPACPSSAQREPGRKRRRSAASPPAPDREVPRRNKKARRDRSPEPLVNGDLVDAERFLRLKVKQEHAGLPASDVVLKSEEEASRKKKKTKRGRSPEPAVDGEPADAEEPPPKKKKNKHKRESLDETPVALVEKFEAAETVVEPRRASPAREPPRALKIRERIAFEEDSVDRAEPDSEGEGESPAPAAEPAEPTARLARYLRAHAGLRALAGNARSAIGPDDDVWVLRAPRSLRPAALQGAALPLDGGRLKTDGRSFDVAPAEGGARAALVLATAGGWRARSVRLRGTLQLRVRVPRVRAAPAEPEPAPATPAVPLPATRARHPLLGADFERALAPRPRPLSKKKKKKKNREQREAEAEPERPEAELERPEAEPERPEPGPGRGPVRPQPGPGRGPRRRAPERWDSERAIEESLFGA